MHLPHSIIRNGSKQIHVLLVVWAHLEQFLEILDCFYWLVQVDAGDSQQVQAFLVMGVHSADVFKLTIGLLQFELFVEILSLGEFVGVLGAYFSGVEAPLRP